MAGVEEHIAVVAVVDIVVDDAAAAAADVVGFVDFVGDVDDEVYIVEPQHTSTPSPQ